MLSVNPTVLNLNKLRGGETLTKVGNALDTNHNFHKAQFEATKKYLVAVSEAITANRFRWATYFNFAGRHDKKELEIQFRQTISQCNDRDKLRDALLSYCDKMNEKRVKLGGNTFLFLRDISMALRITKTDGKVKVFHEKIEWFAQELVTPTSERSKKTETELKIPYRIMRAQINRTFTPGAYNWTDAGGIYTCKVRRQEPGESPIYYGYGCKSERSNASVAIGFFNDNELTLCGEVAESEDDYKMGIFKKGRLSGGYGRCKQPNGVLRQGVFKNGELHGKGMWKNEISGKSKVGMFHEGTFYRGAMINGFGDKFEGRFDSNGKLNTKSGTITRKSGCIEKGKFIHGVRHGQFEYTDSNEICYKATYDRGKLQGKVTRTLDNKPGKFDSNYEFVADKKSN